MPPSTLKSRLPGFALISFLLGPFALWIMLARRKGQRGLLWAAALLAAYAALFWVPVHWAALAGVYLASSAFAAWAMARPARAVFFRFSFASSVRPERHSFFQTFLVSALALYPTAYILALTQGIGDLRNFSIRLPSGVYTDALLWMVYATPAVFLAALAAWKLSLKPGLRTLVFFYAALFAAAAWMGLWERIDLLLSARLGIVREPLLFEYAREARYRQIVKGVFYAGGLLLGTGFLLRAPRASLFLRRALLLATPLLLVHINLSLLLGDWNHYLSAVREGLRAHGSYRASDWAARALLVRVPNAFRSPYLLEDRMEREYQNGRYAAAEALLREWIARCDKPYYAKSKRQAEKQLARWTAYGLPSGNSGAQAGNAGPGGRGPMLDLPIIKPASYLDPDWYALLSAVAYLNPSWTDLDLKKKLLDLSGSLQMRPPALGTLPELALALGQLGVPYSACFLTTERIEAALGAGRVPFLNFHGQWIPVSGFDSARGGFYYYAYRPAPETRRWFRNEDIDLFRRPAEETFGGQEEKRRSREGRPGLQLFVDADELAQHIRDVGGVGLILGDSLAAGAAERRAAFLTEQGDGFYQTQDNYPAAAEAYAQADSLYPSDYVAARKLYLKRRYGLSAGDSREYRNLFREDYPPIWMRRLGLDEEKESRLTARLLAGDFGAYLLMNWYAPPPPDTSSQARAAMDTAVALLERANALDPWTPLYLDSLANLYFRKGDLTASEKRYRELLALYPFGNEEACYRLAWIAFKRDEIDTVREWLPMCAGFSGEARYLTLQGALALREGRLRKAFSFLEKSLKLDRALPETHALLSEYHGRRGDSAAAALHLRWVRRGS